MAADCKSATLRVTEVRILPCAPLFCVAGCLVRLFVGDGVDLSPGGSGRMAIALGVIALMGLASWQTMEPGKFRSLTWVLLGFFAFRVVLGRQRSR